MPKSQHIAIIGAGIVGAAAAQNLAKNGHQVSIFDAYTPAQKTSFANGAHLSEGDAQSWLSPQNLIRIAARNLAPNPPIKIRPAPNPLMVRFLWNVLIKSHKNPNLILTKLARDNDKILQNINYPHEKFHYQKRGILQIFSSQSAMRRALKTRNTLAAHQKNALPIKTLTPKQCQDIAPGLQTQSLIGGIFFTNDATADAFLYANLLIEDAVNMGAKIFENSPVISLKKENGKITALTFVKNGEAQEFHADKFVISMGAETTPFLSKNLNIKTLIFPVAGYSATLPIIADAPHIGITHTQSRIVTSRLGNRLRCAGFADIQKHKNTPDPARIRSLISFLKKYLPDAVDFSQIQFWRGFRPMTPDALPLLGKIQTADNLYINAGHGHLGWTICLASAQMLARLIENPEDAHDKEPALKALNPNRF